MTVLTNNQDTRVAAGTYAFNATGAMDIQTDFSGAFKTLKEGVITGSDDDLLALPSCKVKIINAGAESLTLALVTSV